MAKYTAPRGSFWKPGPEHLPPEGKSRQVRRREAIQGRVLHKTWRGGTVRGDARAAAKSPAR